MSTESVLTQSPGADNPPIGHNKPRYRHMPPAVYGAFAAIWGALVLTYWAIFGAQFESAYMIAVSTVVYLACAGVPLIMLGHMTPKPGETPRLGEFLDGEMDTLTGRMDGLSTLVQVLIIPVALTTATIVMGMILTGIR